MDQSVREHNRKAASMWSSGGRGYDQISRCVAEAVKHCVERLQPRAGQRVLDVATGTGLTSREIARLGAAVVGVDIANGLLDAAKTIAQEQNLSIDYQRGDAEALPFDNEMFDAVVSTFGVMFAPDQRAAVAELTRICRPGGRLVIAAWIPDGSAVAMRKLLVPFMPAPSASPPPSPFVWGTSAWMIEAFTPAFEFGFETGTALARFPSAADTWDTYVKGFGPIRAVAESLDDTKKSELRKVFIDWVGQYHTNLGVTIPFEYLLSVGRRL